MKKILSICLVFVSVILNIQAATNPTISVTGFSVDKYVNSLTVYYNMPSGVTGVMITISPNSGISTPSCTGRSAAYTADADYSAAPLLGSDKIVYHGSGTGILSISNLTAATSYWITIFTYNYNSADSKYYYQCSTSPYNGYSTSATTTLSTSPASYPSPLIATAINAASEKLSFTPVTSTGSLISLKQAASSLSNPVDGTTYTSNAAFATGTDLGSSNYVIYKGTGSSVTATSLSSATNYTASIYSYNGSNGTENYYGTSAVDVSFTTQASLPTTDASGLTANNLDGTSTLLKWTNGNGANRLVTITPGNVNTCLDFDGVDSYIDIPNESQFDFSSAFSVEAWIKVSNFDISYQPIVTKGDDSWMLQRYSTTNNVELYVRTSGGNYQAISTSGVNDGNWHHVAGTFDGTQAKIYVDGVLEATTATTGTLVNGNYNVNIGRNAQITSRLWDGKIDEVRIWNTAQSAANVSANMNKSVSTASSGLKAYYKLDDGAAGSSITAINSCGFSSGIDGTMYLFNNTVQASDFNASPSGWCYSGAKINVPLDFASYTANSSYGSGSLIGLNSRVVYNGAGYAMLITGLSPNTTYTANIYEYNGGTGTYNNTQNYKVTQYAVNSFTTLAPEPTLQASSLTFSNTTATTTDVSWTNGNGGKRLLTAKATRIPTALGFDGVDDYVTIPNLNVLNNQYAITTEAWINADSWKATAQDGTIASTRATGGGGQGGWTLSCGDNGKLKFFYGPSTGGATYTVESESIMRTGRWHHVAATFDGNYVRLYIDGIEVKMQFLGGNIGVPNPSTYMNIGANPAFANRNFAGRIDEVKVWNVCQSASSIMTNRNRTILPNDGNALSSLVGYWKLNDGVIASTAAVNSSSIPGLNGTLVNFSSTAAASGFTATSGWAYQGATVNAPLDGVAYNPYTSYGVSSTGTFIGDTHFVLYDGTGTSASITNLTPNTLYHFELFESNDNGTTTNRNYLTSLSVMKELTTVAVAPPVITSFTPTSGVLGTTVTITGSNFNTTTSSNTVRFGGVKATVLTASATQLTVTVPAGSGLLPVSVSNTGLTGFSKLSFDVKQNCAGTIDINAFSLAPSITTFSASYPTIGLGLFDMDTDGKPDIITNNYSTTSGNMSLIKNTTTNGDLATNTALNYAATKGNQALAYADIDGDGKLDIINSNREGGNISVFLNTTSSIPTVTGRVDFVVGATPYSIAASDMDGDGRVDIVVGTSSASVYVFRNISTINNPNFEGPYTFTFSGASDVRHITLDDLNNDNKPEIIIGCNSATSIGLLTNTSVSGTLSFTSNVATGKPGNILAIASNDLNYDGTNDIVVAYSNNVFETYKNNYTGGTLSFSNFTNINGSYTAATTPSSIALSDLDGDGKPEVVLGYATGTNISVFKNTTSSAASNILLATGVLFAIPGGNPVQVAANDLTADGKPEIIVAANNANIYVFKNYINQTASEPTTQASLLSYTNVGTNGMTVSFTAGNGGKRIVVASQGTAVTQLPIDAIGYADNAAFGSGANLGNGNYVVYNGTSNTVNVTNLLSSTNYYFSVFEYNTNGNCDYNYLTSTQLSGFKITNNATPLLNAVSNPSAICRNSGQQTINLTGIDPGAANETQTLTITATSSNTAVIPNPTVTYTSPNTTGTLKYTPVTNASGTAIITVTLNDNQNNNNTVTQTFTVTVNATPTISNAGSNQDICFTTYNLQANTPTNGSGAWSIVSNNNGLIALSSGSNPNATIGNYNIGDSTRLAWTISNPGCVSSVSYVNIKRVSCPLTAGFTSDKSTACINTSIVYTNASVSGGTTINSYSWTFAGGSPPSASGIGPHTVSYATIGSKNVTLSITDNTAANASVTNAVTIMNKPTNPSSAVSGPSPVCAGSQGISYSLTELLTPYREASYYVWTLPSGVNISAGDSSAYVDLNFANNASTGIITVKGGNQCGESNPTPNKTITVDPRPGATGTITGTSVVCPGQNTVSYSLPAVSAASGYTWNLPYGASIFSGSNSNNITVNFAANAVSGPISVIPNNNCGDGTLSANFDLTVNSLPSVPSNIISSVGNSICEGTTDVLFDVTGGANTTDLIWSVPTGTIVTFNDSSNHIIVNFPGGAQSGNISVYGKNSCGNGPALTYAVTVNPLPAAATPLTGDPVVCQGETNVPYYVSPVANATGYVWNLPAGATIASGANTISITVNYSNDAVSGNISVYATNDCGNGTVSTNYAVTVNPKPATPMFISGNNPVCAGSSNQTFNIASLANATSYIWQTPIGTSIIGAANDTTINLSFSSNALSGNIIVHGNNAICGSGADDTLAIIVNPLPDAVGSISGNVSPTLCPASTGLVYSIVNVNNASSYVWTLPSGVNIISGNGTDSITVDYGASAVSGQISVHAQNSCGAGVSSSRAIQIIGVETQDICVVTVDQAINKNIVVFQKSQTSNPAAYNIYRESTAANVYTLEATIPGDSLSEYVDMTSQPDARSYRYKITVVDSCGNESDSSYAHKTIHLNVNLGVPATNVNLIFEAYEGFDYGSYEIHRRQNQSQDIVIATIPSNLLSYTDTQAPVGADSLYYYVEMLSPSTCSSDYKVMAGRNYNSGKSNTSGLRYTDPTAIVEGNNIFNAEVYPNPNNGQFTLEIRNTFANQETTVSIFDMQGRLLFEEQGIASKGTNIKQFDLSSYAKGAYHIQVRNSKGVINKKVVID